jgi:hypothetical protein
MAVATFEEMLSGQVSGRLGRQDNGVSILYWFDGVEHDILYPHVHCQSDMFSSHTVSGGKNAHGATRKDLQQELSHLLGGKTVAKVDHRSISTEKGILLQGDEQLGTVDGEGKVDDHTNLLAVPFAKGAS